MNCAACVTGSNTMMKSEGNFSDITAFSPAGSSSVSSVTSSVSCAKDSLLRSWSPPSSIRRAMASATAWSAVCFSTESWAWISLIQRDEMGSQKRPCNAPSAGPDHKHRGAVGLRRHHADGDYRLLVKKLDAECADHPGQRQCGFHQRKMRADADPRADAERQIGEAIGRWRWRHEARRDEGVR